MQSFFRKLLGKDDKKEQREKVLTVVDTEDVCVVAVETMRCIICLSIYQETPHILICGHTYCQKCIDDVYRAEIVNNPRDAHHRSFHCPICRKRVTHGKSAPNYALKSLLDSVNEISRVEEESRQAYDRTIAISNEQLRTKLAERERIIDEYKRNIENNHRREMRNYMAISFFFVVYVLLTTAL